MFPVTVYGYVPDKEIGEVLYASYVYHVFADEKNIRFLVWNTYLRDWEIVGRQFVKPLSAIPQVSESNMKMKSYDDLLKKRREEQGNV